MIPKIIHYCWFGKKELPQEYKKYMESWRKHCPDYEIVRWDESNFDISENDYCREAYEAGKWAFVSDYARLKIVYELGGIYLDTDIELLKPLDDLIVDGTGFIGFQNKEQVATGLGFAAEAKNICVKNMLDMYEGIHFITEKNEMDLIPCPVRNTVALKQCGLRTGKASQDIQMLNGMRVLPIEYLNPLDFDTRQLKVGINSYAIHHYSESWVSSKKSKLKVIKRFMPKFLLDLRTRKMSERDSKKVQGR